MKYAKCHSQAEVSNRTRLENLRKKLDEKKDEWAKELGNVLGAYQTTLKSSTGESSFSLYYGAQAVMMIEQNFTPNRLPLWMPQIILKDSLWKPLYSKEDKTEHICI